MTKANECTECGARLAPDEACYDRFGELLALEFGDPAYGAVHHLSVPAYMLQHPSRLSAEGWKQMRAMLRRFVINGIPPGTLRRTMRQEVDSGNRQWRMKGGKPMIGLSPAMWSITFDGIRLGDAAYYCTDVEEWARRVLTESEEVVKSGKMMNG